INALRAENVIAKNIKRAKVIATGEINKAVTLRGIRVSKGARSAIEAAGGKIEE
ncbi:MAG: uL15 family ribosomal protein, partial [Gammaproteobacteria bacterium]